ncbi:MAG: FeoB-associated Cys-rich membrane protein [Eubacterium sp.]|nr:FeoB-associated Cys-rich membrane protein [Eubacterium sp.]
MLTKILVWILIMAIVCGAIFVLSYVANKKSKEGQDPSCGTCNGDCSSCKKKD